jgi:2-phosphosulfolactate phosphatase
MEPHPWDQRGHRLRFDWGIEGARRVTGDVLVVIDVWSFATAVDILVSRGTEVIPCPWRGDRAEALAVERDADLAVLRAEVDESHPWCLSPAALLEAPFTPRLVLPSQNGSAISAAATGDVVAACIRNAEAVGTWLADRDYESIVVIAGGERWPDGSMRPAAEDLLGAGAVIDALLSRRELDASREARLARAAYLGTEDLVGALHECASARELIEKGFPADLEAGAALNVSATVPLMRRGSGFLRAEMTRGA